MRKTDRFLVGFVVLVVVLVVAAFVVALARPKPTYQAEDKPEGVAFNYLLALQQGDYERAYGYLSPSIKGYPAGVAEFREDTQRYSWYFTNLEDSSTSLEIVSSDVMAGLATVKVRETRFHENGLFDSNESVSTFVMTIQQKKDGSWKIIDSDRYWVYCWDNVKGCQ